MKNFLFALSLLFILTTAFALEESPTQKRHFFSIAEEILNYTYKEPYIQYPVSHKGTFAGVAAEYKLKNLFTDAYGKASFRSFFSAELRFLQSNNVDYDGYLQNGSKSDVSGVKQFFTEAQAKFGIIYYPSGNLQLQPYIGLGLRYFEDQMDKNSPSAYRRKDTYFYAPLGITAELALPKNWSLAFTTEYDWFLNGKQKSRVSDVNPGYSDFNFNQQNGFGFKFSLKAAKQFKKIGIFAEPFFRYWKIEDSSLEPSYFNGVYDNKLYYEPLNTTSEWGLKAGIMF